MVARPEVVTPVRVASVFVEKTEPGIVAAAMIDDGQTEVLDRSRVTVLLDDISLNDGCTYYEQLHVTAGWIKLGLYTASQFSFNILKNVSSVRDAFNVLALLVDIRNIIKY